MMDKTNISFDFAQDKYLRLGLVVLLLTIMSLALGAKGCGWSQEEDIDNNNDITGGSSYQEYNIIKANEQSTINTSDNPSLPACEVSTPPGAVVVDIEVTLEPFEDDDNLPTPLPEDYVFLGGANLKPTRADKVNFTSGKGADAYIILPPSVKAEELSNADIRLMEFIDGQWVIVLPNKRTRGTVPMPWKA